MKVLLESRRRWWWANLVTVIRMFPVITKASGGELYMSS